MTSDGVRTLAIVAGALAHSAYSNARKTVPLKGETITSNGGSRMMFAVWLAGIAFGLSAAISLSVLGAIKLFDGNPPDFFFWSQPVLAAVAGAAYSHAAILRAKDAGRSRVDVVITIIVPVFILWLIFARPKEAPERPPYVPASDPARVAIALCAVAAFVSVDYLAPPVAQKLATMGMAERIKQGDFKHDAPLPAELAETSVFQGIEPDVVEKVIYYQYGISGPGIDRDRIRSWLEETLKPDLANHWCQERLIADRGWTIWYEYRDPDDRLVASTHVSRGDCRRLKSE